MKWTDAEDIGIALAEKFPGRRSADHPLHRSARARARARRLRRRSEDVERAEARSDPDGVVRGMEGRAMSARRHLPPGHARATSFRSSPASSLAVSAFLPWVIVGDVGAARRARRRRRCGSPASASLAAVLAMLSLDHAQELAPSAAGHRAGRARHHVPVVAHHAAHGRRARADMSQAFAIVENTPIGARRRSRWSAAASTSASPRRRARRLRPDDRRQARGAALRRRRTGRRRLTATR